MRHPAKLRVYAVIVFCILAIGTLPILGNVAIDPIDRDQTFSLGLHKERVAVDRHAQLYKTARYLRSREPFVILGDSRARALREKYFTSVRLPGVYNYAFGGGTMPEALSAYWDAAATGALKGAVIGVPLRMFSERYKRGKNQVLEARVWIDDPWRYYSSMDVFSVALDVLEASVPAPIDRWIAAARDVNLGTIMASAASASTKANASAAQDARAAARARKWKTQIEIAARSDWRTFKFAESYFDELQRVAAHAKANGISLIFFIPPTPLEMQVRIEDFGRTGVNFSYRKRLAALAPVVDFDFYSAWTDKNENFKDAYHFGSAFSRQISAELARFLSDNDKLHRTVAKRRDGVFCPTNRRDPGARVIEGQVTLLVGESCRVWISKTEETQR